MSSASMSSCSRKPFTGIEFEMQIEFGEVEDLHRQAAARRMRGSQPVGCLPDIAPWDCMAL